MWIDAGRLASSGSFFGVSATEVVDVSFAHSKDI